MLVITIERWYASKNYKSYESAGSRLGYGLCILQVPNLKKIDDI